MPDVFVAKKAEIKKAVEKIEQKIHDPHLVTLLSTFTENPSNISFHNREDGEKIHLFLRSHLLTNLRWLIILIFFAAFPFFIFLFGTENLLFPSIPAEFTFILLLMYYLILFAYAFSNFLTWYFNIFVITEKRVVDIDFVGLVFHDVAETQFSLLQDVNYTQSGPIRHFFNFGDVFAQTAGGKENLEALAVPKPSKVTSFITRHMGRTKGGGLMS